MSTAIEAAGAPVYLDNAATTRVDDAVAAAMMHVLTVEYGNPSSVHRLGAAAARLLGEARERLARAIGADPRDVYFTSGGTEANAMGVLGAADVARGRHVVVSAFEHSSVLESARRLKARGFELDEIAPDPNGVVPAARVAEAVRPDTAVVALMRVQNELGTIQPSFEVARLVKEKAPRAHVHVDAVQALGKIPLDVAEGPIDSLAVSAHKIHGPKGAGAFWLRRGARITSITIGGGQEHGVRPGTENAAGAVGLGLAAELAERARPAAHARWIALRARLVERAKAIFPTVRQNGDPALAAPHITSLAFPGVKAEPLLHALEAHGVYASAGSACSSKNKKPSATLRAVGVTEGTGVLRVSFSRFTTEADVDHAAFALAAAIDELRPTIR